MPTLAEITSLLDEWYPPTRADSWDAVGLVCGDPEADVRRILLAVDPVDEVAAEAVEVGADMVVCHHPLFLKGVHSVAATTPKGRLLHRLMTSGTALFTAHTNADSPAGGVSEALALALGLVDVRPLDPDPAAPMDKLIVFAPHDAADRVRAAWAEAGAGAIGDYDACTFTSAGEGRFRPLEGANPAIGEVGTPETVAEVRIETVCPRRLRQRALDAMRAVHPYEEPAFDVVELAALPEADRGSGRIGRLERPLPLRGFADRVLAALPETAHGVRVAGDPGARVESVALCGGAGDFLLDTARASGADVYLTSDLRHHPVSELREHDDLAVVDVAHWAAESTWLPVLAGRLGAELGDTVDVRISAVNTDPWTFRV